MPINVNDPEYVIAEKAFHEASTPEEQLIALNKMISHAPKHKGGENLRQQLTTRRKKLESQIEKKKKSGKSTQVGIKKGEMQAIIVGNTNSGKSSLMKILTNAEPKISQIKFTTNEPQLGMMDYKTAQIQLVEIPAIDGEHFDKSLAHTADTVLIIINSIDEIEKLKEKLYMITGKKIFVFNKIDSLSPTEQRKIKATLQSKKYNFVLTSTIEGWPNNGIEELKEKILNSFDIIKVYTKEPGKEKSKKPMILKPDSTVKDVAEKILKGLSKRIKKVKIWGPSSKFSGQVVGLNHKLKDMDTVEFTTK
jgi:ribosome-interacting GTPase 1